MKLGTQATVGGSGAVRGQDASDFTDVHFRNNLAVFVSGLRSMSHSISSNVLLSKSFDFFCPKMSSESASTAQRPIE